MVAAGKNADCLCCSERKVQVEKFNFVKVKVFSNSNFVHINLDKDRQVINCWQEMYIVLFKEIYY